MDNNFDEADGLGRQQPYQSPPFMSAQNAGGMGAYQTYPYSTEHPVYCHELAPAERLGQHGHPTSTHSQDRGGLVGYSAEQMSSRAMDQDPRFLQEDAVHSVNGPNQVFETMEDRHAPLVLAHDPPYYQDDSVLSAHRDTRAQPEFSQQAQTSFPNCLHGTTNSAYADNGHTLSHLGGHAILGDACGTLKSPSGDLQSQQYYCKEPEIAIDPTLRQEYNNVYMTESIPGSLLEIQNRTAIILDSPDSEPWTPLRARNGGQTIRSIRQIQAGMGQPTSHTYCSMSFHDNPSTVSSMCGGFEPLLSSVIPRPNQRSDILSEGLYILPSSAPGSQMDASDSCESVLGVAYTSGSRTNSQNQRRLMMEGAVIPARAPEHPGRCHRPGLSRHLPIPGARRASSASSQVTDATSSSAVSSPNQCVLECGMSGCNATFSGRYRKSNQARHERTAHREKGSVKCGYSNCSRSFNRSDARLKHYRSDHPDFLQKNP